MTAEEVALSQEAPGGVILTGGQPKRWYYTRWGEKMLLPADPWSMERYLANGRCTLEPPVNPEPWPIDGAEAYVGQTALPPGATRKDEEVAPDDAMVAAVLKALDTSGFDIVKRDDTPTESDTKLNVSQVSSSPNGEGPSIKDTE